MFNQRIFFVILLMTFWGILSAQSIRAQSDPIFEEGFKPFGSFQSGDIDTVNLLNLELNLHIPFVSFPQRGENLHLGYILTYTPTLFIPLDYDCGLGNPCFTYDIQGNGVIGGSADFTNHVYRYSNINVAVTSADGSVHQMGVLSTDGTGYQVGPPPPLTCPSSDRVTDRHGIVHKYGCTASGTYFETYEDPNGNIISANPDINNKITLVDSMNRNLSNNGSTTDFTGCLGTLPTTAAGTWTVPALGGTATYKSCFANVYTNVPGFCGTSIYCSPPQGAVQKIQSILLPNGTSWVFQYDSADPNNPNSTGWGDLLQITFPTGGSLSYTWTSRRANTGCSKTPYGIQLVRSLVSRTLNANDGQGPQTWTYTMNAGTTVQDPLGNQTVHTFTMLSTGTVSPSCKVHETLTQWYQGTSTTGTLLQTVATNYIPAENYGSIYPNDYPGFLVSSTVTTLPNGQQKVITFGYEYPVLDYGQYPLSDGNVVQKIEYDYSGNPAGTLPRTTTSTYLSNSNSNYLNNNLLSLLSSVIVTDVTGQRSATTYGYDEYSLGSSGITTQHDASPPNGNYRGNLTSTHRWLNGSTASTTNCPISVSNGYLVSYNLFFDTGTVQKATDSCGTSPYNTNHTTTFAYSGTYYGAYPTTITNPLGQTTTNSYDFNTGRLTAKTDPNGQTTSYSYDTSTARPTIISLPDGGQTSFCYSDITGSSCAASPPYKVIATQKITASVSKVTTNLFDGLGRLTETQLNSDPSGTVYSDIAYDAVGRQFKVWNPTRCASPQTNCGESTWGYTTYNYDPLNRVTSVVEQDGGTVATSYVGNCTTVTDEAQHSRKSCTDGVGRMTGVWEDPGSSPHLNYQTSYTYNALDNLISVTQSSSRSRSFTYDSLSRLTQASNPESGTINYAYDANGNLVTRTDARGIVTNYSPSDFPIDSLNRVRKKTYSNGDPAVTYGYDGNPPPGCAPILTIANGVGRRTGMCDASGWAAWTYDAMGRIIADQRKINGGMPKDFNYSYNLDGSIKTLGYPSGRTITYSPNSAGQPVSAVDVANNVNYAALALYAPQGALGSLMNNANILSTWYYNNRLQPCRITVQNSGIAPTSCADGTNTGNVLDYTYNFNSGTSDNGNVGGIANNRDSTRSQTFGYDNLNRLLSAQTTSTYSTSPAHCWGESYVYDQVGGPSAWGNLIQINPVSSGYTGCVQENLSITVNNNNQINSSGYLYDSSGNLTAAPPTGTTYAFNAENQMKQATTSTITGYVYDGDGKRVEKTSGGEIYKIYWYGMHSDPLAESDGDGNITDEYIYFNGKRIAHRVGP